MIPRSQSLPDLRELKLGLLSNQSLLKTTSSSASEVKSLKTARWGSVVFGLLTIGSILLSEYSEICGEHDPICKGFALPIAIISIGATLMCILRGWCSEVRGESSLVPFSSP